VKPLETRVTALTLVPEGEAIFSEYGFCVELVDDAAGEYVTVEQQIDTSPKISIDPDEWPALRSAINRMVRCARKEKP